MESPNKDAADLSILAVDSCDKQPVQKPPNMLPPEVLSLVCGILCKGDLKRVRQVSKIWEQAAVPHLFDEIFISLDMADFRIAKLVIRHFSHYIRTLVFSSTYYEKMDRESFSQYLDGEPSIDFFDADIGTSHIDYSFVLYSVARKKQQENITNKSYLTYLSFALANLPRIRKIVLTDTSSSRSMPYQSLQVYQSRRLRACPFKQCGLIATDHLPDIVRESGFSRRGSTNPWRLMLSALSATNENVRELTMEPGDMELSTDTAAFSMSPRDLSQAMTYFRNLTKLRLSLDSDSERFSTNFDTRHVHRNVAKLLRSAINLESLSLDLSDDWITDHDYPTLQEILGQCRFPKLKSLILSFLTSSDEELLQLLRYSKNLEQITIACHTLTKGSWMRVASWIRASLPLLKHVELDQLYGGFDDPLKRVEFLDLYGEVRDFLFAHGENPFTKKAIEKHEADKEAGRQVVDLSGRLGYIGAYIMYH